MLASRLGHVSCLGHLRFGEAYRGRAALARHDRFHHSVLVAPLLDRVDLREREGEGEGEGVRFGVSV